ncbi:MAG: hypothetical protein WCP16_13860 [Pseudanabaena sp. ELA645]|jgi:hypothetical protein
MILLIFWFGYINSSITIWVISLFGTHIIDAGLSPKRIWVILGNLTTSSLVIGFAIGAIINATTKPVGL